MHLEGAIHKSGLGRQYLDFDKSYMFFIDECLPIVNMAYFKRFFLLGKCVNSNFEFCANYSFLTKCGKGKVITTL